MVVEFTKNDNEIKRLRSTHALYDEFAPEWDFYLSAYEGGSSFARRENLFKHARETDEDFNDRVRRLHNLNYCQPLVDFFTNFIFTEPIERDGGPDSDFFNTFTKNVSLRGDSINEFSMQVCDDMQIFGMSYIMVDSPKIGENIVLSKAMEAELGIRPYWILIKPREILDWVVDPFMNYTYVKRMQLVDGMIGSTRSQIEVYTEMLPDRFVISRVDITDPSKPKYLGSEVVPNALNEVPIVVVKYKVSKKYPVVGLSFLRDLAYNNREIMNLTSLLQEFLYRQAFNVLAKEVDDSIPLADQQDGVVGTSNVVEVPKGAAYPQYISPPSEPAKFIQDERSKIKNEMFLRAAQDTLTELFNGEKASGFSQAQSFSKTVPFISTRADTLERVENRLMQLTMKMMGKEWAGKIRYKDRYELTNLTDALNQLLIIVNDLKVPSETFVRESLKRVVAEFDDKLPNSVKAKIYNEIDNMDFNKWQGLVYSGSRRAGLQQLPKDTGTLKEAALESRMDKTGATKKLK